MATTEVLTDEEKRLLNEYDPALKQAGLAEKIEALIESNNDLEARVTALENV